MNKKVYKLKKKNEFIIISQSYFAKIFAFSHGKYSFATPSAKFVSNEIKKKKKTFKSNKKVCVMKIHELFAFSIRILSALDTKQKPRKASAKNSYTHTSHIHVRNPQNDSMHLIIIMIIIIIIITSH